MLEISAPSFSRLTTLRLGGNAVILLVPETLDDLFVLPQKLAAIGVSPFFLGRGSNLLARSGEIPLALVSMRQFNNIELLPEDGDKVYIRAEAGVPLAKLLRFCLHSGLSGLEGLVGIPGSVGGACAMNAGSFGDECGNCLCEIEALINGNIVRINKNSLSISYRKIQIHGASAAPLIVAATFALTRREINGIFERMNLNYLKKKTRQPLDSWNAGCTFKNPSSEISAGKLLDNAGFKGRKIGGVAFSQKHANFLVNEGNGTAEAAFELISAAQEAIYKNYGIMLEPEIKIIL